jgi:predicted ribosome quality control (RQC) complex YloA/Tae2 family protein
MDGDNTEKYDDVPEKPEAQKEQRDKLETELNTLAQRERELNTELSLITKNKGEVQEQLKTLRQASLEMFGEQFQGYCPHCKSKEWGVKEYSSALADIKSENGWWINSVVVRCICDNCKNKFKISTQVDYRVSKEEEEMKEAKNIGV